MKTHFCLSLLAIFLVLEARTMGAPSKENAASVTASQKDIPAEIKAFIAAKETQAKELAKKLNIEMSPDIWAFFDAAKKGDGVKALELHERLRKRSGQYEGSTADPSVRSPVWTIVVEVVLAVEAFIKGDSQYALVLIRK